ncbi:MAG: hypothetical protein NC395_10760 [Prevotella sp.]|nr:hypothetical protein [Prevotella sp.]
MVFPYGSDVLRTRYYCDYVKSLVHKISSAYGLTVERCNTIIETLVEMRYLYNFDGRLTCIPAVRNFECVQSTRISNRTRGKVSKTNENAPKIDEKPIGKAITLKQSDPSKNAATVVSETEEAEEPLFTPEEIKFFQEQAKKSSKTLDEIAAKYGIEVEDIVEIAAKDIVEDEDIADEDIKWF